MEKSKLDYISDLMERMVSLLLLVAAVFFKYILFRGIWKVITTPFSGLTILNVGLAVSGMIVAFLVGVFIVLPFLYFIFTGEFP